MDVNELKEILQLLDERQIAEFELEKEGIKLRIRRVEPGQPAPPVPNPAPPSPALPGPGSAGPVAAAPAPAASASASVATEDPNVTIVRSPIVGTFYRAPAPEAEPFTDTGQRVQLGQVLCVIEAMKLMNEIEAETAGEVIRVHVENGSPVQYGDPLFSIRTA